MTGSQFGLVEQRIPTGARAHGVFHGIAAQDGASRFAQRLDEGVHLVELLEVESSLVSGAHAGWRTVGAAFYAEQRVQEESP